MKRFTETIQLKDILVLTATNEITVSGTVFRDHLHFETRFNLTSTLLNVLMNQLQKLNPDIEVSELFETIQSTNQLNLFLLDASNLTENQIDLSMFQTFQPLKQIRA